MKNKTYKNFGDAFLELKEVFTNISYGKIARELDITDSYAWNLPNRRRKAPIPKNILIKLAEIFKVKPSYFYEYRLYELLDFIDNNRRFLDHCLRQRIIIPFLALILVFGFGLACSGTSSDTPEEFGKLEAYVAAQIEVEGYLKAPATAEFPLYNESFVYQVDDNNFNIRGYVDSENSFGAMIRTNFTCKVEYLGNDEYRVYDINFSE